MILIRSTGDNVTYLLLHGCKRHGQQLEGDKLDETETEAEAEAAGCRE